MPNKRESKRTADRVRDKVTDGSIAAGDSEELSCFDEQRERAHSDQCSVSTHTCHCESDTQWNEEKHIEDSVYTAICAANEAGR